jgi:hypothetical protein
MLFLFLPILQGIPDGLQDSIHILHHVIVPEPQHPVAARFEVLGPLFIIFRLFQVLRPKGARLLR